MPMKKRSMLSVTDGWFWMLFQALSISSLQWISSKMNIEFFAFFGSNQSKYLSVADSL
jgi:hypothetical protein